jgi:hypothetical protein
MAVRRQVEANLARVLNDLAAALILEAVYRTTVAGQRLVQLGVDSCVVVPPIHRAIFKAKPILRPVLRANSLVMNELHSINLLKKPNQSKPIARGQPPDPRRALK